MLTERQRAMMYEPRRARRLSGLVVFLALFLAAFGVIFALKMRDKARAEEAAAWREEREEKQRRVQSVIDETNAREAAERKKATEDAKEQAHREFEKFDREARLNYERQKSK